MNPTVLAAQELIYFKALLQAVKNRGAYLEQTKGFSSGGSSNGKQGEMLFFQ